MNPLMQALLMGLRANCEATICAIDLYLNLSSPTPEPPPEPVTVPPPPPPPEPVAEPEPEPKTEGDSPETCQHPNLVHAPVMGNQGRFICRNQKCRAEVNK